MSFFSEIFQRKSTTSMRSVDLLRELIASGGGTKAGVTISRAQAMQCVTAFACARVIAEGLAQVPFKLMQKGPGGGPRRDAVDHPLYELLALQPNDLQTSFELREQIALHMVFCFQAFIWKNTVRGKIVELLAFEPGKVRLDTTDQFNPRYYVRLRGGLEQEIPRSEMWHMRGPSWDGITVLDPIRLMREAIGLSLATEEHGARLFSNGAQMSGILSTEKNLDPEQRKSLREAWEEQTRGNANAFRTAITWGGLKWMPSAQQNDQAQFLETRRMQVEEVCRGMRVLPIMVGFADKTATYASAEAMFTAHLVYTMHPWYERFQQSAMVNLLSKEDRSRDGLYCRFAVNAWLHASLQAKADYVTKMWNVGALNSNEIRDLDERNPYAGGEIYRVPLNTGAPDGDVSPAKADSPGSPEPVTQ